MIKKLQNSSFYETDPSDTNIFVSYRKKSRKRIKNLEFSFEDKMKIVIEGQSSDISIDEICRREGITAFNFHQWTQEFLEIKDLKTKEFKSNEIKSNDFKGLTESKKFRIVIEGKTGETSIAEICRRENISQELFLEWSGEFQRLSREKLQEYDISQNPVFQKNKQLICRRSSTAVFNYLDNYVDFSSKGLKVVLKSNSRRLDGVDHLKSVVSLQRINDVRYINKYFEKVNLKLQHDGIFIGCFETLSSRKLRKRVNKIPLLNNIYFSVEFLFKRILPKVSFTKKHYFDITKGNDRLLSKAEGLGRLVSCGFKIMDFKTIDGLLYFVVKKDKAPSYDMNPSYGPLYKMPRLGKNGKIVGVYKFRTMHPYSEYLQDYIVKAHGYSGTTGKPADDFRIPKWGKIMRRFWLDEIPQLFNVLRGELKLVGIRPVSQRYFQDIPKEMQTLRLTQKPGCVPPYVALNRSGNVMSVLQAEKEYLEEKIRNPYLTDTKYLFKAIFNIVFKHKRSA